MVINLINLKVTLNQSKMCSTGKNHAEGICHYDRKIIPPPYPIPEDLFSVPGNKYEACHSRKKTVIQ
jgi:hypothetical protein